MAHFVNLYFPTWEHPEERYMAINMDKVITIKPSKGNSVLLLDINNPEIKTKFLVAEGTPEHIVEESYRQIRDGLFSEEYASLYAKVLSSKVVNVNLSSDAIAKIIQELKK